MIKFRQKDFSVMPEVVNGAAIGSSIALAGTPILFRTSSKAKNWAEKKTKVGDTAALTLLSTIAGGAVGATLGLVAHAIKSAQNKINRVATVDKRLMDTVISNLKKDGNREGTDFTRDPKKADLLKTKVCIVITKNSGELQTLVNMKSDTKLKTTSEGILKNLPNTAIVNKKLSDKFNDISISTISDSSADAGLITGIAEYFIHSGYPVYLVEVG